jgi:hypothetical protein
MGKLLQFGPRELRRLGGTPERTQSADILMFTGVRYEREAAVSTSSTPTKPTASPGHKRKRG